MIIVAAPISPISPPDGEESSTVNSTCSGPTSSSSIMVILKQLVSPVFVPAINLNNKVHSRFVGLNIKIFS